MLTWFGFDRVHDIDLYDRPVLFFFIVAHVIGAAHYEGLLGSESFDYHSSALTHGRLSCIHHIYTAMLIFGVTVCVIFLSGVYRVEL